MGNIQNISKIESYSLIGYLDIICVSSGSLLTLSVMNLSETN